MKNLTSIQKISFAVLTFLALAITSCSKDEETQIVPPTMTTQNPLDGYLVDTGYNQQTVPNTNDGRSYEFGVSFSPLVNGKLTAIVVKIPDVNPNLRVTIWNKATGGILRTELVNVSSSGVEITKTISPIEVTTDKEYVITMNSNDYYRRSKTNNSPATYPVTVGDIKITSYALRIGTEQIMPIASTASNWLYSGDLSFEFQK